MNSNLRGRVTIIKKNIKFKKTSKDWEEIEQDEGNGDIALFL